MVGLEKSKVSASHIDAIKDMYKDMYERVVTRREQLEEKRVVPYQVYIRD